MCLPRIRRGPGEFTYLSPIPHARPQRSHSDSSNLMGRKYEKVGKKDDRVTCTSVQAVSDGLMAQRGYLPGSFAVKHFYGPE